jgi:hypothetical protein
MRTNVRQSLEIADSRNFRSYRFLRSSHPQPITTKDWILWDLHTKFPDVQTRRRLHYGDFGDL